MRITPLDLSGGVVAVHAHPDDETLTSGGLLAQCARNGVPVTLVTCTRGEQGEVIGEDPLALEGNPSALGIFRESELAAALQELGVTDHLFLDEIEAMRTQTSPTTRYCDSGMAWVAGGSSFSSAAQLPDSVPDNALVSFPIDVLAASLADVIEDRNPAYVVTYEPGGGYGHPDHIRAFEMSRRACELIVERGLEPPLLLSAVIPQEFALAGRSVMHEQAQAGLLRNDGYVPELSDAFAAVSSHDLQDVLCVDVRPVFDQVVAALRAHATQVQWVTAWDAVRVREPHNNDAYGQAAVLGAYALSNNVYAPLFSHEYYVALA
ncbi:PIG-L family deacetylase [Timonella sp. A28]|uniref:PIG-L family deacetylase n=1 Tax=Timonella sp. A28 TaxID=3442640 RepID=UPI003EB854F2